MSEVVIRVENLSKLYRIGARQNGYRTLRESIATSASSPFRRLSSIFSRSSSVGSPASPVYSHPSAISFDQSTVGGQRSAVGPDTIWALRDVSFEVKHGEVVGIIGRNGAGKSTLLKVLSRITEPTEGYAEIRGRVGSLLEVGTGFHAELSGRENIYLNGAILGMSKAEIERKFDEIVAFAEIEKFLDTPVKHYSSGMYVRLAFAVAAHLDPEILLVDEVLAVGDASFQKKCLEKMQAISQGGRTVIFVSHQMTAVNSLCSRVIEIQDGTVKQIGDSEKVISGYLAYGEDSLTSERMWKAEKTRPGDSQLKLNAVRILNSAGEKQFIYRTSEPILVEIEFELMYDHKALFVGFDLISRSGTILFRSCHNHGNHHFWPKLKTGLNKLRCTIPAGLLNGGIYYIAPRIALQFLHWIVFDNTEVGFEVQLDHIHSPFWSTSHTKSFPGLLAPCLAWQAVGGETSSTKSSHAPI